MISKGNPQKKMTFEDKFYRKFVCGKENHPGGWHKDKIRNRKKFRRLMKKELEKELDNLENE